MAKQREQSGVPETVSLRRKNRSCVGRSKNIKRKMAQLIDQIYHLVKLVRCIELFSRQPGSGDSGRAKKEADEQTKPAKDPS